MVQLLACWAVGRGDFPKPARFRQGWTMLLSLVLFIATIVAYYEGWKVDEFFLLVQGICRLVDVSNPAVLDPATLMLYLAVAAAIIGGLKSIFNSYVLDKGLIKTNLAEENRKARFIKKIDLVYYSNSQGKIVLEPHWKFAKQFMLAMLILSGIALVCSIVFIEYLGDFPAWIALPVFLFLEVYRFLNGEEDVFSDAGKGGIDIDLPGLKKSANYYNLWEEYQKVWDDKWLLAFHYRGRENFDTKTGALKDPILRDLPLPERQKEVFRSLEQNQDIIISNIRYGESAPVLFTHLLRKVLDGERILVITPKRCYIQSEYHKSVKEWFDKGVEKISGNDTYWKSIIYDYTRRGQLEADIVISSAGDLLGHRALDYEWFSRLTTLVFVYADDILAADPSNNHILLKALKDRYQDLQVIMLSQERSMLQGSIRRNFEMKEDFKEIKLLEDGASETFILFWELEGSAYENAILRGHSISVLGPEAPLSLLAMTDDVCDVEIVEQNNLPYIEYPEELKRYFDKVRQDIIPIGRMKGEIEKRMYTVPYSLSNQRREESMVMVRDTMFNAPMMLEKWNSFGNSVSFVHIISPPYMLREYFIDNFRFFKGSPLYPLTAFLMNGSRFSVAISLLERMILEPVPERIVRFELDKIKMGKMPAYRALRELFLSAFRVDLDKNHWVRIQPVQEFDEQANDYKEIMYFTVNESVKDHIELEFLKLVRIVEQFERNVISLIPYDLVNQRYAKGQHIALNGRLFQVETLETDTMTLRVKNIEPTENIVEYRFDNRIHLHDMLPPVGGDVIPVNDNFRFTFTEGRFDVATKGYFAFKTGIQLVKNNTDFEYFRLTEEDIPPREYPLGRMLVWEFITKAKDPRKVEATMVVLLQELMPSLFPENYKYIIISAPSVGDSLPENMNRLYTEMTLENEGLAHSQDGYNVRIFMFEDAHKDLGLLGSINVHWKYIFRLLDDYLTWLEAAATNRQPDLGDVSFLTATDYRTGKPNPFFLSFGQGISAPKAGLFKGLARFSPLLDLAAVKGITTAVVGEGNNLTIQRTKRPTEYVKGGTMSSGVHQCDFCGQSYPHQEMNRLGDGREQCSNCSADACTEEDVKLALEEAYKYLKKKKRKKELPKDIDIRVCGAVEIQQARGEVFRPTPSFDPRSIGLAIQRGNNYTILIESHQPYYKTLALFVHELTHIWQYSNTDFQRLKKEWGIYLVEGHTTWAEIDCLSMHPDFKTDERYRKFVEEEKTRKDDYGEGYRLLVSLMEKEGQTDAFKYIEEHYRI